MDEDIKQKEKQLIKLVSKFTNRYLNTYYRKHSVSIVKDLARHPEMPLKRGKLNIWAAGVLCAVSQFTPMFDKFEEPHSSMEELCIFFNVKNPTVYSKARKIMQMLNIEKVPKRFILMR